MLPLRSHAHMHSMLILSIFYFIFIIGDSIRSSSARSKRRDISIWAFMSKTSTGNDCVYSDEIKEKLQKFSPISKMILAAIIKVFSSYQKIMQ